MVAAWRVPRCWGLAGPRTRRWRCRSAMSRMRSGRSDCWAHFASCCRGLPGMRRERRSGAVVGQAGGADRGFAETAEAVVDALDAGDCLAARPRSSGCACWRPTCCNGRARIAMHSAPTGDVAIERIFGDLDVSLSVARGPRTARQARRAVIDRCPPALRRCCVSSSRTCPC